MNPITSAIAYANRQNCAYTLKIHMVDSSSIEVVADKYNQLWIRRDGHDCIVFVNPENVTMVEIDF